MHHSALLVIYLEQLQKRQERALIGAFSDTTEAAMKDQQTLDPISFPIGFYRS